MKKSIRSKDCKLTGWGGGGDKNTEFSTPKYSLEREIIKYGNKKIIKSTEQESEMK